MRFLLIFDDNVLRMANTISKDELSSADNGYVTIVDIENSTVYYGEGEWRKIPATE